jgi:hypothetical protein
MRVVVHNHLSHRAQDAVRWGPKLEKIQKQIVSEMDADTDFHEAVSLAMQAGATREEAEAIADNLGR